MSKKKYCDIFVSGGGLAGLITALALADEARTVICCDLNWDFSPEHVEVSQDLRVTALFNSSLEFLGNLLPLEPLLNDFGKRLAEIEVLEAGKGREIEQTNIFKALALGQDEFGWVVPNTKFRMALVAQALQNPNIIFLPIVGVQKVLTRTNEVHIFLTDGTRAVSKLLVGADGRSSQVRKSLNIHSNQIALPQGGITFNVKHPIPLRNKSIEIYQSGGPFTIIPLPGESHHHSNIIWMDTIRQIETYGKLDVATLAAEATKRSQGVVGDLALVSPSVKWSCSYQMARQLNHERSVLIAEAAHNLPPLGAQGLNLSIGDISLLKACLAKSEDPGDFQILSEYGKTRYFPTLVKFVGTNLHNLISYSNIVPLQFFRKEGTRILATNELLHKAVLKFGLGENFFPFKPIAKTH